MKYQHLVATRYTVIGWAYDEFSPEWLTERIRLFRTYCVPSMAKQQVEDFSWLIGCDETTDPDYVEEVKRSSESVPQLRICTTSRTQGIKLRDVMRAAIEPDTDILITTRLDNDDALHERMLATVHEYIAPFARSPHRTWVLHFPRGYRYDEESRRLYACYWMNSPFSTSFEKLGSDKTKFWDVYRVPHTKLQLTVPVHNEESIPAWLQVIHGHADSTRPETLSGVVLSAGNRRSRISNDDIAVEAAETATSFGLDLAHA